MLRIETKELAKIHYWIDICPKEISGLGLIKIIDGVPTVTKVFLLEQQVSCVETELDSSAVADCLLESMQHKDLGTLSYWWHSHANMGVFWSKGDEATRKELSSRGFFYSTVFNKRGESKTAYDQGEYKGYPSISLDDLELETVVVLTDQERQELQSEYENKVSIKRNDKTLDVPLDKGVWVNNGKHGLKDERYTDNPNDFTSVKIIDDELVYDDSLLDLLDTVEDENDQVEYEESLCKATKRIKAHFKKSKPGKGEK